MYMCFVVNPYVRMLWADLSPGLSRSGWVRVGNFTSRDFLFFCAVFARIRRLGKSPQYALAILQWKLTAKSPGSRNSLDAGGIGVRGGEEHDCQILPLSEID